MKLSDDNCLIESDYQVLAYKWHILFVVQLYYVYESYHNKNYLQHPNGVVLSVWKSRKHLTHFTNLSEFIHTWSRQLLPRCSIVLRA